MDLLDTFFKALRSRKSQLELSEKMVGVDGQSNSQSRKNQTKYEEDWILFENYKGYLRI
jgi:hypothetical protein